MAGFIDPVAQTFFVDAGLHRKGVYVHSVDLVFYRKDTTTYQPFKLQLRPTVNGYPHSSMIHSSASLGEVSLLPEDINIVDLETTVPDLNNPSHYTRFEFGAPVHLLPGEHAIVMYTNSDNYSVYVSEIGDVRLGDTTGRRIDKQPYVGSFFKSQNGSTYTASQEIDLMFRVNFCQFSSVQKVLYADNVFPEANLEYDIVKLTSRDLSFQNTSISYSYLGTSNTTLTLGSTYDDIILEKDDYLDERNIVLNDKLSFRIKALMSTQDPDVAPIVDVEGLGLISTKYHINDCGLQASNFSITNPGSGYAANVNLNITGLNGQGSGAVAKGVYNSSTGTIDSVEVTSPGSGYVDGITVTPASGSAQFFVESELDNKGGPALARYITRNVTLADGFDANFIRVILDGYQPYDSTIEVYYRVLADEDPTFFTDRPYVRMKNVQQGNENLLNSARASIPGQFIEYLFIPETDDTSYISNQSGILYNTFKTFSIKIVMRTANPARTPIIKNLRVLALAP